MRHILKLAVVLAACCIVFDAPAATPVAVDFPQYDIAPTLAIIEDDGRTLEVTSSINIKIIEAVHTRLYVGCTINWETYSFEAGMLNASCSSLAILPHDKPPVEYWDDRQVTVLVNDQEQHGCILVSQWTDTVLGAAQGSRTFSCL